MNSNYVPLIVLSCLKCRNILAVAEKGKKPSISLYDLEKFKHIRQLTIPYESKSNSFIKIKFSYDDVYVAALSGDPDYTMYYYNWRQSKVESHLQVVTSANAAGPVSDVIYKQSIIR